MPDGTSQAYAERLVAVLARERKRLSHEALAEAAGVHCSTISLTECGKMNPSLLVVHAMASALGLSFAQVAKDSEQTR